ncbi:hypothetical protein HYW54_00680 [Candidatus Gottesmanbacteria bacterium]|nr:hypothetical protein [Candidatus Gottesmanbacteria bacterium]
MDKKLKEFYKNNKLITWAAVVGIVLTIGVLIVVPDEVTRFTLIMPIFAGFILFSILVTDDEELEDKPKPASPASREASKKSGKK